MAKPIDFHMWTKRGKKKENTHTHTHTQMIFYVQQNK